MMRREMVAKKKKQVGAVLVLVLFCMLLFSISSVTADEIANTGNTENTKDPVKSVNIEKVHSIYWKAELRTDKRFRKDNQVLDLDAGTKVIVVSRPGRGNCVCIKDGVKFSVPYSALKFISDACTIKSGDYSRATKENFVNVKHDLTSKTKYLIWASLDKQRVNVFQGSGDGGDWKLVKVAKCSSGGVATPTRVGFNMDIGFKQRVYHYANEFLSTVTEYFMEFSGSGFHKWVGSGMSKNLGKHPVSHGCIRVQTNYSIWMFENIPVGTRVVIY